MGYDDSLCRSATASEPMAKQSDEGTPRDSWVELAQLALATEHSTERQARCRPTGGCPGHRPQIGRSGLRPGGARLPRAGRRGDVAAGRAEPKISWRQRISKLIGALNPEDAAPAAGGGRRRRVSGNKFVLNASQILAADAVMEVVEAAARVSDQTISHNLLRLLHKLAQHAEAGLPAIRAEADGALRNNVARLIGDWKLEDPNPKPIHAILEGMVRQCPARPASGHRGTAASPKSSSRWHWNWIAWARGVTAVDEMLTRHRFLSCCGCSMQRRVPTSAEEIWHYVATPTRLELSWPIHPSIMRS